VEIGRLLPVRQLKPFETTIPYCHGKVDLDTVNKFEILVVVAIYVYSVIIFVLVLCA
jgi:hypothetical protein